MIRRGIIEDSDEDMESAVPHGRRAHAPLWGICADAHLFIGNAWSTWTRTVHQLRRACGGAGSTRRVCLQKWMIGG